MFTSIRRSLPAAVLLGGMVVVSATTGAVAAGMITGADIKNGSVTGTDIKDGSLGLADLAGAAKSGRLSNVKVKTDSLAIPSGQGDALYIACPSGTKVLSVEADWTSSYLGTSARIDTDRAGASVYGENTGGSEDTLRGWLICGKIS